MIHYHFHVRDINLIPSNPLFTFRLLILLDAAAGDPDVILVVWEGLGAPVSTYPTRGADPTPARLVRFILNHRQTKNYDNYSQFSRYSGQPLEGNYYVLCVLSGVYIKLLMHILPTSFLHYIFAPNENTRRNLSNHNLNPNL